MRKTKHTPALLMMVLCLSWLCFSQSPDTGSIRGQILDQNGAAIVGAEVSALNQQTGLHREPANWQVQTYNPNTR
jgi:hypothetical protein